jgi:SagB-type dehydrogenase family enzyme
MLRVGRKMHTLRRRMRLMKTKHIYVAILFIFLCSYCRAQDSLSSIQLPKPDTTGGKSLMQVLKERRSTRSFSQNKLSLQIMSNLLWAAFGINRPDGRRTAPSAMNWQEIDIFVATEEGLYMYEPTTHSLKGVLKEDIREKTGNQSFVKDAPVNLVYVADYSRTSRASEGDKNLYAGADCGFIAQNVYLYCASEGLACVVRGSVERVVLEKTMRLRHDQKIVLTQTVGNPSD